MSHIHRAISACLKGWPTLFCYVWITVPATAQTPAAATAPAQTGLAQRGFSARQVSFFSSYYSVDLPRVASGPGNIPFINSDSSIGGSAIFGYATTSEKGSLSLQYTPSYTTRLQNSAAHAFSNALTLQIDRTMTSQLRFSISSWGAIRNREESQFSPVGVSMGASTAAAPLPGDTAAQALLFGSRVLSGNLRLGIQYSLSPRLSLTLGVGGSRTQFLQNRSDQQSQSGTTGLIPQVTAVASDVGLSYALTPRTTIAGRFDSTRQQSRLQNALITNGQMSISHMLTQRWVVNGYGGLGHYRLLQQSDTGPGQLQYIAGGGTTYQTYAHSVTGTFSKQASDIYGLGATSSRSLNGIWRWAPAAARSWLTISFGRTELQGDVFPASTWRGTTEVGSRISGNVAIFGGYAYMGYSSLLFSGNSTLRQNAVRFGLTWVPQSQTAVPR